MLAKQSTALSLIVGPILDSTGAEYTAAVIGDLSLSKNGGTLTALAAAATLTHIANAQYTLSLTTGNTDTLGVAQITCNKSTYQMPMVERQIVPANIYDSLVAGSDLLDISVVQLLGTAWLTPATAGTPDVNVKLISSDATAADNAEAFFDGTGYAGTNNVIPLVTTTTTATNVTTVNGLAANVITAASIAADAITDAKVASDVTIASVTGAVGSVTGAVGSVTAGVTVSTISADVITASALATDAANEIADTLLKRDWTSVTGEAARSMLNALRMLRNKWSVSAGTLTVTKEDDTTSAWTAAVTSDAAAEPIVSSDPA